MSGSGKCKEPEHFEKADFDSESSGQIKVHQNSDAKRITILGDRPLASKFLSGVVIQLDPMVLMLLMFLRKWTTFYILLQLIREVSDISIGIALRVGLT